MFNSNELEAQLDALLILDHVPYESVDFYGDAAGGAECTVIIDRGPKPLFRSGLHFFVDALRGIYPREELNEYCAFIQTQAFDESDCESVTNWIPALWLHFQTVPPRGKFIAATHVYRDWNEWSVVAEFEAEYLFVFWMTAL